MHPVQSIVEVSFDGCSHLLGETGDRVGEARADGAQVGALVVDSGDIGQNFRHGGHGSHPHGCAMCPELVAKHVDGVCPEGDRLLHRCKFGEAVSEAHDYV